MSSRYLKISSLGTFKAIVCNLCRLFPDKLLAHTCWIGRGEMDPDYTIAYVRDDVAEESTEGYILVLNTKVVCVYH